LRGYDEKKKGRLLEVKVKEERIRRRKGIVFIDFGSFYMKIKFGSP